jgi:hypothetical protein
MSRQLIRQRPPADDDLQAATEEDKPKLARAAATTARQASTAEQASRTTSIQGDLRGVVQAADRSAYFVGRYSPEKSAVPGAGRMSLDMVVERRMAEFNIPDSLRHCVMELIHILRDHGLGAALAALHNEPAIDARHQGSVGRLLVAVAETGARP